jgi:hypothetical protein
MSGFEPPEGPPEPRPERPVQPPVPPDQQQYQQQYPPPFQQPRRFAGGSVALGVVAGFLGTPILLVAAGFVTGLLDGAGNLLGLVAAPLAVVAIFGPMVASIVFASKQGSPQRRGFALGYVIGVASLVIAGAGLCVAVLAQLGSSY